jgi:hypothetical protein
LPAAGYPASHEGYARGVKLHFGAQGFLDRGDDQDVDSMIAEALAHLLKEARQVVHRAGPRRPDISPWSGLPCHPALAVDWNEGDPGFVDWLADCPCSGMGFAT